MTLSVTPSAIAQRPYTDVCFAVAYVVTLLLAVGVGLYAASKSNVNDMLTMPTQCGTGVPGSSRLLQTTSRGSTGASSSAPSFNPFDPRIVNHLGATTAWGISLALAASFLWMTLLQRAARFVVYAVLIAKTIFIFTAAVFCTMLGSFLTAGFFAFCGLILIWVLTRWPQRLRLTSTLLEQSVSVSRAHPGIFPAALGLLFCALLLMAGCVGAGLALYTTGSWQKTLVEPEDPELGGGAFYACRYQVSSSLVYGGWGVLAVCAYWSFELFFAIRFHVVALTTGVWYYKNLAGGGGYPGGGDSEAPGASLTKQTLSQPICTALRLAFTRSFGSLCLASLILTICEWLKRMARRSARDNGLLGLLIACCIMCILNYIEFLTRFAICFQALTGGSFCSSAKTFKGHLERHGLKAMFVDWVASVVLSFGALLLSLIVGAATAGIVYKSSIANTAANTAPNLSGLLVGIGIVAAVISQLILCFVGGILINILDASYTCMVLDLDNGPQALAQPEFTKVLLEATAPNHQFGVVQNVGQTSPALAYPAAQPAGQPRAVPIVNAIPVVATSVGKV